REVDRDAAAAVGVERLDDDGQPDPPRRAHGLALGVDELLARDRQAEVREDVPCVLLVRGHLDGDVARLARDRGLDPLLVLSVAELDEAVAVEPEPRDVPCAGRVYERLRARPELAPLRVEDERVALSLPVEPVLGLRVQRPLPLGREEVEEELPPEPRRLEPDVPLLVLE